MTSTSSGAYYQKWLQLAPLGLLFTGLGLSVIGYAAIAKSQGRGWFFKGTLGLILFNGGLSIFAEAVKSRTLYEAGAGSQDDEDFDA